MKISKKKLNFLIGKFLYESENKKQDEFEALDSQHIDRYGKPLSKQQRAYKESNPTIYLDDLKSIPNTTNKNKDNYPSLEDFYEEYISLAALVRQNTRNLNGIYPKIAQDKYDIKRLLKKLKMEEDPIFINKNK